jgi:hypothetical protein
MDWVALPVLNRVSNPIYCFLSHCNIANGQSVAVVQDGNAENIQIGY